MVVVGDLEAQIRDTEASLSKATIEAERLKTNLDKVNME
jgi:hypothetical protein